MSDSTVASKPSLPRRPRKRKLATVRFLLAPNRVRELVAELSEWDDSPRVSSVAAQLCCAALDRYDVTDANAARRIASGELVEITTDSEVASWLRNWLRAGVAPEGAARTKVLAALRSFEA